jgi:hypothetical protein
MSLVQMMATVWDWECRERAEKAATVKAKDFWI